LAARSPPAEFCNVYQLDAFFQLLVPVVAGGVTGIMFVSMVMLSLPADFYQGEKKLKLGRNMSNF